MGLWRLRQRPSADGDRFPHANENEFRGAFSDYVFTITDWSPEQRFLGRVLRHLLGNAINPLLTLACSSDNFRMQSFRIVGRMISQ